MPSARKAASARSTRLSRTTVTGVPYGIRDDRHGDDGWRQVDSPRARPLTNVGLGEREHGQRRGHAVLAGGCRARPIVVDVVGVRAIDDRIDPAFARDGTETRPELGLAEVATVGRVRGVSWIVQLVRIDFDNSEADLRRDGSGALPLIVRIRRAPTDDTDHAIDSERFHRNRGQIRRVDAAAVADGDRALGGQPLHEPPLLVERGADDAVRGAIQHA